MTAFLPAPVSSSFDYSALTSDKAQFVRQRTEEIVKLDRETTDLLRNSFEQVSQNYVKLGQWIIEIKEELEHGQFKIWIETFFAGRERTAQNYMTVARNPKGETISALGIDRTINFFLSRPSTPEQAVLEVIDLVEKGEKVTVERTKKIIHKHKSFSKNIKGEKNSSKPKPSASEAEIIDAELEEPPQWKAQRTQTVPTSHHRQEFQETFQLSEPASKTETVSQTEQFQQLEEVKALPPSPPSLWWRLTGFEQKHLLFCGHPDESEFIASLPARIGVWLGSPPTPNQCLCPPQDRVQTALFYSTIYKGINLNAIRQLIEGLINETSSEEDKTAMLAYLPDAPLLLLFDDFGLDCYVAEPSESQCQEILKTWKLLGGKVEKIDNLEYIE